MDVKGEKVVSVRLETELFVSVQELAAANDRTVSAEIRQAIRSHLTTTEEKAA